ncbi:MAG TPA: aminotransferase class V-fold PLP-dependent enzyme [Pyrinomonadaceae bacterium]
MTPEIRSLFPVTKNLVYLNHAAVSPPPTSTIAAIEAQLKDVNENGSLHFQDWIATKEKARQLLASMLGAKPAQVAFMRNTSDGLSTIANGLSWKAGDNLVTFSREFPSNIYPWLRLREAFGVEVRMCDERDGRIDFDELARLVDSNTCLISISHVQYASGFRADLERLGQLARKHDALLVVDVIQALGVVPIDVSAQLVDAAAGAGHKWLLSPEGVGYLYLSDRARERIQPTLVGWISVRDPEDYNNFEQPWNEGALAWETGTGPASLFYGFKSSLELITNTGVRAIAEYLQELTDYLCERVATKEYDIVSSRLPGEKSHIVCIKHRGDFNAMKLYSHLKSRNIITAPRGDRLRIAPHLYNTRQDIDALIESLP